MVLGGIFSGHFGSISIVGKDEKSIRNPESDFFYIQGPV